MATLTIEDVNKNLEESLTNVFENERFQDLLDVMASHKAYSLNNNLLIMAQRPTATMVMGYKEWMKLGRHVEKGEKAIRILAPNKRMMDMEKIDPESKKPVLDAKGDTVTEKKSVITGFRMVSVFDVEQTDGKEIPQVQDFINRKMSEDDYMSKLYHDYKDYLVTVKERDVREEPTENGVGGYFNRMTNEIVVSSTENETDTQKFRVLIHEYGHSLLHHKESEMKDLPRGHKEAQAESVAYVISKYYGLDTEDVSSGYIATWSQDMHLAKQAIKEIQEVANIVIDDIDRLQKEQIKDFYQDQTKSYEEAKNHLINYHKIDEKAFDPSTKEETRLQLINKENGYLMSGTLKYNEKTDMFYLKTNRNLIEPLSELSKDGSLTVLNVEKELDQLREITAYSRIPDHYEVKEIKDSVFVVQSSAGQDVISKTYTNKEDAEHFHLKASMSQSLHQSTMLKVEKNNSQLQHSMQEVTNEIEEQINKAVGQYLAKYSDKEVNPIGNGGTAIGWALLKNPDIKSVDQLEKFAEQNKHVPSYKNLQDAIVHISDVSERTKTKANTISHGRTMER